MELRRFITLFAVCGLAAACEDADYSVIDNNVYIQEAVGLNQQVASLTVDGDVKLNLTIRLAQALAHDVTVKLDIADELVEAYNGAHNTNYQTLPSEYIDFAREVVIPAGHVAADPLVVSIGQFRAAGVSYAFPIRIVSAEGADVMAKTSRMLYRLSTPHYQKAIVIGRSNHVSKQLANSLTSNKWTVEFWVNISDFTNPSGGGGGTFDGCELIGFGSWFLRFWNAGAIKPGLPCLQWQGSAYFDSSQFWHDRTWYHLAYVSDGAKIQMFVDGEPDKDLTTDAAQTFSRLSIGGGSYNWRSVTASLAQIRLWNKPLAQSQIQDAMNREVATDAEGLLCYWKCDEGEGNVLKDVVGGNDITLPGTATWSEELNFSHMKD